MHAGDEPLVFEFRDTVEGVEEDVAGEESEAGAIQDQEGVALSAFKLPLPLEGSGCETCDVTATAPSLSGRG